MSEKANILLVDDQPAKLLTYEVMLADLGENLIKAGSAKEALRVLLKHDIAVVLTDVSMPEMSGFELADTVRQHPRFQKVAIIFVSALHLTDRDRLRGYAHGAVDYVSVPIVPEVLCAKVRVFVELHRKTRQLERMNQELERRVEERTAALRSSEQFAAMGRMAGTIAHEINNPLEAIVNALFLLYNQPSLDEEARRYASIANQELLRLSHIARQTLSFYRESQQALPVSLAALVDEVLELQSSLLKLNKIELRKRYRTQKTILGFPAELKQVFVNLIGNAIQAMTEGG